MNREYKKVLFISHNSFSKTYNNGKTYSSLFEGWPKDRLAQLYFRNDKPDLDTCNNYFKIVDKELLTKKKKDIGEAIRAIETNKGYQENQTVKSKQEPISMLYILRDYLWDTKRWKNEKLINWLDDFYPEVIFFVAGGSLFSYKITKFISDKYNIPIIVYYTDDYLTLPNEKFSIEIYKVWRLNRYLNKLKKSIANFFVISNEMKNELELKFNIKCVPIMNCIELDEYNKFLVKNKDINKDENKKIIKLAYFGGLHLNRWEMLDCLGSAIEDINLSKTTFHLDIYCAQEVEETILRRLTKSSYVRFMGAVDKENIISKMLEYDLLIHVESFDPKMIYKTRLSISTKIPEYLACGKPILYLGPKEISTAKYLKNNTTNFLITEYNKQEIIKSLNEIFKIDLENIGENNRLLAEKYHNSLNEREKIYKYINNLN